MKRLQLALILLFIAASTLLAQTTGSPLNLALPDVHSPNWNIPLNSNFTIINNLVAPKASPTFTGTSTFNNIVINGTCSGSGCPGGGGGGSPIGLGTSQFANNNATAFFSGGVKNTDAVGGITAAISAFTCTTTPCQSLIVPPTSTDTTHANAFYGAGKTTSFFQDQRGNSLSTFIVNPALLLNDVNIFGASQSGYAGALLYTEPSNAPVQGAGQQLRTQQTIFGAPGFAGPGGGCPLNCPLPPHTSAAQWASHTGYLDFFSFHGSGINNARSWFGNCFGTNDCQPGSMGAVFVQSMGGYDVGSDEGVHGLGSIHNATAGDFEGTLTTIVDANHIFITPAAGASTQGQGRFVEDLSNPVIGTDSQPLSHIISDFITPASTGTYGTLVSSSAHFPVSYAAGTLTQNCTTPVQEGGVAIGQNGGVNGCQVTVTSGTFDTAAPVCMAADRGNQFNIGMQISAVTSLSGGHQTITGTIHRSVPTGGFVFQGGMCGAFISPVQDGNTDNGQFVNGSQFPLIGSIDAHTVVYINYDASQIWQPIPNKGSQWGTTAIDNSFAARGMHATSVVRTGNVVTGIFDGAAVQSSPHRYQAFNNALFFQVTCASDSTFNVDANGTAGFLPGPAPNTANPNVANFSYTQTGGSQPDSTCSDMTIVPLGHVATFFWGAEIYDVMNHSTGAVDGTMAVSYQPNFVTGRTMDSPPHYSVNVDSLNISDEVAVPVQNSSGLVITSVNHAAITGAAITILNHPIANETKLLGGASTPSDVMDILLQPGEMIGNLIHTDVAPAPDKFALSIGPPNALLASAADALNTVGLIGLDVVQGNPRHGLYFNDHISQWEWRFNGVIDSSFSISPTLVNSKDPILTSEYRFTNFPAGPAIAHFKQCSPIPTTTGALCYATDVEPTAQVTQSGTPGSTNYAYTLTWNDTYGPAFVNSGPNGAPYQTFTGNATLSGSNFNIIPCTDLPAGASGGQIWIFINPVWHEVGACPNSSTIIHDTGSYTGIFGANPLIDGTTFYSGAFAATGTTGGFLFTQPDYTGLSTPSTTITAGISQLSAGNMSLDTTAIGNSLGTLKGAQIIGTNGIGPASAVLWTTGTADPTGACSTGSLFSNTAGAATHVLWSCVASAWVNIN